MTLLQNNFWNIINLNWLVSTSGGKSWEVFTNEFYTSQSFSWSRDFLMFLGGLERKESIPANIYLFKVNNRNARKRCKIFSKLTIKTPERHQQRWNTLKWVEIGESSPRVNTFSESTFNVVHRVCKDILLLLLLLYGQICSKSTTTNKSLPETCSSLTITKTQ